MPSTITKHFAAKLAKPPAPTTPMLSSDAELVMLHPLEIVVQSKARACSRWRSKRVGDRNPVRLGIGKAGIEARSTAAANQPGWKNHVLQVRALCVAIRELVARRDHLVITE